MVSDKQVESVETYRDLDGWRERALELERTIRAFNGLLYRLARDGQGGYRITFIEGSLTGSTLSETGDLVGRNLSEFVESELLDRISAAAEAAFAGGRGVYRDPWYPAGGCSEGTALPFSRDPDGTVTEIVCTVIDITARKMAEDESDERRARLEALVSALPDLIFIFDRDGIFVGYNVSSDEQLLAPPSYFLGTSLEEILPAEVAGEARRVLNNVVMTGQRGEFHYQLVIDGKENFYHARMVPFQDDKVMAVVRNITDLVLVVRNERMKSAQLDISARVARLGYWRTDVSRREIYWSPEAFEMLNIPQVDEVTPEWIGEVLGPDTLALFKASILGTLEKKCFRQIEFKRDTGDGDIRHFMMSLDPVIPASGPVNEVNGTVQDITELRRLEFQLNHLQKIDSLGSAAGAMVHDFNNMLQVINGYGECLRKYVSSDNVAASYLEAMLDASEKTRDLVAGILRFSRRTTSSFENVVLDDFIDECGKLVLPLLGSRIDFKFTPGCPGRISQIDKTTFTQVMVNLSVNARDAMTEGGTLTWITRPPQDQAEIATLVEKHPWISLSDVAVIEVSDTGTGIPETILDKIFEPFFSTKDDGAGTGLGLSTACKVVKRHKGSIYVKQTGSEGSTFVVLVMLLPV